MKYYGNLTEEGTTDVNGAWKALQPLSEGFEFAGEDQQYDNFGGKAKARREERQQARSQGLSRKDARKEAKNKIPTDKPARREAYLALVKINFRGFAYKLDAIINGTNTNLLNKLKEKWRKWGDWNQLIEAVNKGKDRKPFVCGAKCRKEALDAAKFYNAEPLSTSVVIGLLSLAGVVVTSLSSVVKQGQIGKQQRDAIDASEKQSEDEFNNLSPEEQRAILEAEAKLRSEIESSDNKKYIYIGVGVLALVGLFFAFKRLKK